MPGESSYGFRTGELTLAAGYSAVVEYTETRPELTRALIKRMAIESSSVLTFEVHAWASSCI